MKLKMGKKKVKSKSKPKKVETTASAAPANKKKRIYASATGVLSDRASRVDEHLQTAIDLITLCAQEIDTWNADDGKSLREVANDPGATVFWDHTMRELGRNVQARMLLKDAADQAIKLTNQVRWYQWAFKTLAIYDAARRAETSKKTKPKALSKPKKALSKKAVSKKLKFNKKKKSK